MYRICTQQIVLEDRILFDGNVVTDADLDGLTAYFLRLGLIEAVYGGSIDAKRDLSLLLSRLMPAICRA